MLLALLLFVWRGLSSVLRYWQISEASLFKLLLFQRLRCRRWSYTSKIIFFFFWFGLDWNTNHTLEVMWDEGQVSFFVGFTPNHPLDCCRLHKPHLWPKHSFFLITTVAMFCCVLSRRNSENWYGWNLIYYHLAVVKTFFAKLHCPFLEHSLPDEDFATLTCHVRLCLVPKFFILRYYNTFVFI